MQDNLVLIKMFQKIFKSINKDVIFVKNLQTLTSIFLKRNTIVVKEY